jgi:thiol-disulfide isomerase/thioredoxin
MSTGMTVAFAALWVIVIVQGVLLLLLYRHFGLQAMSGHIAVENAALPVGQKAPPIPGVDRTGGPVTWVPRPEHMQLLLFAAPDCGPCIELLPHVDRLARAAARSRVLLEFTVVVSGDGDRLGPILEVVDDPAFHYLAEPGRRDGDDHVRGVYGVEATPFAFVIGANGRIVAKAIVSDIARVRDLIERSAIAGRDADVVNFLRDDPDVALAVIESPAGPVAATRL